MSNGASRIRIFRKGNGLVQVHPSPAILQANQQFQIVNTTTEDAEVTFAPHCVVPDKATLSARSSATFTAGAGPAYVEFDVKLASGHCAEGGSKPGAIIDP